MKKYIKFFLLGILVIAIIVLVVVFSKKDSSNESKNTVASNSTNSTTSKEGKNMTEAQKFTSELKTLSSDEIAKNAETQMAEPEEGETIAIFHIENYGDITVKFFDDIAPKAVENFVTHAKEGYYNGVTFHRVINEFMIQGGDPLGNGTGGESIWGEDFAEELSTKILPYKGALCMASRGTGTKSLGSQFYIVQANYNEEMTQYLSYYGYSNLLNSYKTYSGDLFDFAVAYQYTTFGQVIDGLDIVDKIASVETDSNDKPVSDVVISSIEVTTYSK